MTYIRNNECQFIPLDYISFENASVTFGKMLQGKQNKIKVNVSNLNQHSKFERLLYAYDQGIFINKNSIKDKSFYFNL